jgi:hypothetical protein
MIGRVVCNVSHVVVDGRPGAHLTRLDGIHAEREVGRSAVRDPDAHIVEEHAGRAAAKAELGDPKGEPDGLTGVGREADLSEP